MLRSVTITILILKYYDNRNQPLYASNFGVDILWNQIKTFKSGYVAIVGKPNVGKSTLINDFLGCKLSIVTPKPQTTRKKIMGVLTKEEYQIVFYDTPGIMEPKYELQKYMVKKAYEAIEDAD